MAADLQTLCAQLAAALEPFGGEPPELHLTSQGDSACGEVSLDPLGIRHFASTFGDEAKPAAALIVAAVNVAPALVDALRRAGAARREAVARAAAAEAEARQKTAEAAYCRAALVGQDPTHVPARVRLAKAVRREGPLGGDAGSVDAGDYDALVNRFGAVSVLDGKGERVGLRFREFEVLEWREVPQPVAAVAPA